MNKLWVRLTGAFLLVGVVTVLVMGLVMSRMVQISFEGYVGQQNVINASGNVINNLETFYSETGSWDGADDLLPGAGSGQGQGGGERRGGGGPGGAQFTLIGMDGFVVASTGSREPSDHISQSALSDALPLSIDEQVVGWLLVETPGENRLNEAQEEFLDNVQRSLIWMGTAAAGLALIIGITMSRLIARPLGALTEAAQAVASGELGRTVGNGINVAEELQVLTHTFNQMSQELEAGELQRQRMTADIAHELRTPLSVMRGQLQAMLEEVTPTSPEQVAVVYDQTLHLVRLVNDLRTLTQAEAGHLPLNKIETSPQEIVERAVTLFHPLADDAGLTISGYSTDDLPSIMVDPDRIQQVLANLLANALRHTPANGNIEIWAEPGVGVVRFTVSNSGGSLTAEQAEHVFDRFWRADEARSQDGSGAGLGLAISREIVHLHGGTIRVKMADDRTIFVFDIPDGQ